MEQGHSERTASPSSHPQVTPLLRVVLVHCRRCRTGNARGAPASGGDLTRGLLRARRHRHLLFTGDGALTLGRECATGGRPGHEHDTTALRTDPEALPLLGEWSDKQHAARADLGYEGGVLTTPVKRIADRAPAADQRTLEALHAGIRAPAECWPALPETKSKALRRVSLCHWRIRAITAAALVLLEHQHDRTTWSTRRPSHCWEWPTPHQRLAAGPRREVA